MKRWICECRKVYQRHRVQSMNHKETHPTDGALCGGAVLGGGTYNLVNRRNGGRRKPRKFGGWSVLAAQPDRATVGEDLRAVKRPSMRDQWNLQKWHQGYVCNPGVTQNKKCRDGNKIKPLI